jgi:hypothetical protein
MVAFAANAMGQDRAAGVLKQQQAEEETVKPVKIPKPRVKPPPPPPPVPLFSKCDNLPDGLKLTFKPLPPIDDPSGCIQTYPLELSALNPGTAVHLKPPATVNCNLAASLGRWLEAHVQPLAKLLFKERVARLINVASYSCRTRYGRPNARMSEHAFANALDIAGFVLASGRVVAIKTNWDKDSREARFLYAAHRAACRYFGTTLGPEANAAHHDHFHLDMVKRRHRNFCE